jgi:hypothetical protein
MKKNKVFLGLVVLLLGATFIFLKNQKSSQSLKVEQPKASTDLLNSALTNVSLDSGKTKTLNPSEPNLSCKPFWEQMVRVPIKATLKSHGRLIEVLDTSPLKSFLGQPVKECQPTPQSALLSAHQAFLNQCQPGSGLSSDSKISSQCILTFLAYRLRVIDSQSSDQNISEMTDISALSAKIFAAAFSPTVDLSKIQQIAHRILELEPNNGQAMDYSLTANFADWEKSIKESDNRSSGELEKSLEDLLARAKEMGFSPLKLAEFELNRARLQNNPKSMLEIADSLEPEEGMEGFGSYYKAWASHLLGEDEEMVQQLKLIKEKDPFFASAKLALEPLRVNQEPIFFHNLSRFVFAVSQKP